MRVLIVEDDSLVGDGVRRALTVGGFAADLVSTAGAAKAAIEIDAYDLIVADLGLPRESGLQPVQSLRNRGQLVPVLILTARDGMEDRVGALDLGADDYPTKPFYVPELLEEQVDECYCRLDRKFDAERDRGLCVSRACEVRHRCRR